MRARGRRVASGGDSAHIRRGLFGLSWKSQGPGGRARGSMSTDRCRRRSKGRESSMAVDRLALMSSPMDSVAVLLQVGAAPATLRPPPIRIFKGAVPLSPPAAPSSHRVRIRRNASSAAVPLADRSPPPPPSRSCAGRDRLARAIAVLSLRCFLTGPPRSIGWRPSPIYTPRLIGPRVHCPFIISAHVLQVHVCTHHLYPARNIPRGQHDRRRGVDRLPTASRREHRAGPNPSQRGFQDVRPSARLGYPNSNRYPSLIHRDKSTYTETIRLVREDANLWTRGDNLYPAAGSDTLRVPFSFSLPPQLPPSFQFRRMGESGTIRYSLTAVGVRKGFLNLNKKHCQPLAVLPRDQLGAQIKSESATHTWKPFSKEELMRRGLWGDYAKATVEVCPSASLFCRPS